MVMHECRTGLVSLMFCVSVKKAHGENEVGLVALVNY